MNDSILLANQLLRGGYDLHVHSAPSHSPRIVTDLELLSDADAAEMAGVIIKCHYEPTEARATICNCAFNPKYTKAYGSITLNYPVGGINPYAVESAVLLGAKMIWMPTCDSAHNLKFTRNPKILPRTGLSITDSSGAIKKEVFAIFEIAKQHGIPVATGHLSNEESRKLCFEGQAYGVQTILTHPEWVTIKAPLELQLELADRGTIIEKSWVPVPMGDADVDMLAASIKKIGAHRIIMSTDFGAAFLGCRPTAALRDYISAMLDRGISSDEISVMIRENPEKLILTSSCRQ